MHPDIERRVRTFIEENFLFREDAAGIGANESLLEAGLIDSTGVLELVAFLEADFHIAMADAEIVPANLDSISAITAYVNRKLPATSAAA